MAPRKRTNIQKEDDRREIASLYLHGKTQQVIADRLHMTRQMVGYDLKAIQRRWREDTARDLDADKARELAKIDELERTYWVAWESSLEQGETTALSANTVVRLKEHWGGEYEAWRQRPLGEHRYAYVWADGVYLAAGTEKEKTALLCVLGAREDGVKELLAMEAGYRESTESWAEVLRNLRDRGLSPPLLAVGDGALGLWAALGQVLPVTEHQRCWNHRVLNVQSKLPKRLQAEARGRLREMAESETQALCEERRDGYVAELRSLGQRAAAETVLRDWEDFVAFYHYPKEHWVHLRTSNPIESIFSGVRLRTNAARRLRCRDNALYLVFKLVERPSGNSRVLNGEANLMALVLASSTKSVSVSDQRATSLC